MTRLVELRVDDYDALRLYNFVDDDFIAIFELFVRYLAELQEIAYHSSHALSVSFLSLSVRFVCVFSFIQKSISACSFASSLLFSLTKRAADEVIDEAES